MERTKTEQMQLDAKEQIKQQEDDNWERFSRFIGEIAAHSCVDIFSDWAEAKKQDEIEYNERVKNNLDGGKKE